MKIKDLPENIKALALNNQNSQYNYSNEDIELTKDAEEGNFDWGITPEGYEFWQNATKGDFDLCNNYLLRKQQKPPIRKVELNYFPDMVHKDDIPKQVYYKEFSSNEEMEKFIETFDIKEENIIETKIITKTLAAMWHYV